MGVLCFPDGKMGLFEVAEWEAADKKAPGGLSLDSS